MDLTPSPRLLEVLGDIPYQPWQCLAELIDNAFDGFLTRAERPDDAERPTVWIEVPKSAQADGADAFVRVADNGPGMDEGTLERSLRAGYSGNPRHGSLGLFGMGFNIATARLGRTVDVKTTRAGDDSWAVVTIDFRNLQARHTFQAPMRYEGKDDPDISGTEVIVTQLTPGSKQAFKRSQQISVVKNQLGKVYSYLLRDGEIPGVPSSDVTGRGYVLKINSQVVTPRLPCVWSADRYVTVGGRDIPAVIPIDRQLSTAYACQSCPAWHAYPTDTCSECGSEDVQPRERRVHGWLGIQRYLDQSEYGIDFLRHGRKILIEDKRIFMWEDPTGLSSGIEYPIEVPANQGRIVGEIHLDHVEVNYQKNDFARDTREWVDALRIIRGEGPIQPKKARDLEYEENTSPLARLFTGYRRNDPGLKCLVPGDGKTVLREKSRQWGKSFHNGQQEYQSDEIWYQSAAEHDRIKQGLAEHRDTDEDGLRGRMGLGDDESPQGAPHGDGRVDGLPEPNLGPGQPTADEPRPQETDQERFARYRSKARPLPGIDGQISLGRYARKRVGTYLTGEELRDPDGNAVPSLPHQVKGGDIEVFVNPTHPVFTEYGRDPRDFALIEIAEALRTMSSGDMSLTAATAEVIGQFPDQRFTDMAVRERAEGLLSSIQSNIPRGNVASTDLWNALSAPAKETTETRAASANADVDWEQATRDGSFVDHLDGAAVAELVREVPDRLLDGHVFRTKYASWSSVETRARVADRVARMLDTVAEYLADSSAKSPGQLKLLQVTLDILDADLDDKE